jgi:bifunctional DNA-binding transcriptional regulator/antitoxin component of YhaV-PrlF toxin-antitoxin module
MKRTRHLRHIGNPSRGQTTIPTDLHYRIGQREGSPLQIGLLGDRIEIQQAPTNNDRTREFTEAEISQFLADDRIDEQTVGVVRRLLAEGAL